MANGYGGYDRYGTLSEKKSSAKGDRIMGKCWKFDTCSELVTKGVYRNACTIKNGGNTVFCPVYNTIRHEPRRWAYLQSSASKGTEE